MTTTRQRTSTAPVETGVSYDEFLRRYAGQFAEWVAGSVFLMSPETDRHDKLVWLCRTLIEAFVDLHPGYEVRDAPFQARLGPDLPGREPDVMVIASERRQHLHHTFLDGAPDIAVEVISPESEQRDRKIKYAEYETAGVREYWLIDPLQSPNDAEFYLLESDGRFKRRHLEDGWFESGVLIGLRFEVNWLLADPPPSVNAIVGAMAALDH